MNPKSKSKKVKAWPKKPKGFWKEYFRKNHKRYRALRTLSARRLRSKAISFTVHGLFFPNGRIEINKVSTHKPKPKKIKK